MSEIIGRSKQTLYVSDVGNVVGGSPCKLCMVNEKVVSTPLEMTVSRGSPSNTTTPGIMSRKPVSRNNMWTHIKLNSIGIKKCYSSMFYTFTII